MSEHLRAGWRKVAARPPAALFHYTSGIHFPAILAAGHLRLTDSNISMSGAGPRVVWLTSTPTGDGNGLDGFIDKAEYRFVVDTYGLPIHHWPEWSREQGIEEFWYDALASTGGGRPENWWVCTEPIRLGKCIIERRVGGAYEEVR